MATDLVGKIVANTYRVDQKLGEGGMGAVYRAHDTRLDRQVALKVIRPELSATPDFVKRFEREARVVAKFAHPSWVQVYATGEDQGLLYMALEFVEGRELAKVLRERGTLDVPFAARLVREILGGLEKAHELGIVHRDLKPANVMVVGRPGDERVKILDLGIAKLREGATDQLTAPGMVLGTLAYMSPEQASGDDIDGRSDLYSVGIMLYELLTSAVPFSGRTPTELITQHITARPKPLRERRADLSAEIEAVVLKALEKQPRDRFADARSFANALEPFTRVLATPAVPVVSGSSVTLRTCHECGNTLTQEQPVCKKCGAPSRIIAVPVPPTATPAPSSTVRKVTPPPTPAPPVATPVSTVRPLTPPPAPAKSGGSQAAWVILVCIALCLICAVLGIIGQAMEHAQSGF
jgi:serine/threonine-protein kinase